MSDDTDGLRGEIAEAIGAGRGRSVGADDSRHPESAELVAYRSGTLPEAAARGVGDHVFACAQCREDLLDLDSFLAAGAKRRERVRDFEAAVSWRSFRAGLDRRRPALSSLLAAALALAALGLGIWALQQRGLAEGLRERVSALVAPQPNAPIVDLFPRSSARGSAAGEEAVALPSGADFLTLVLNLPESPGFEAYEAELLDASGRVLWQGELRLSPFGTFRLGIWRSALAAGEHEVRLYGKEAAGRRLLETYSIHSDAS